MVVAVIMFGVLTTSCSPQRSQFQKELEQGIAARHNGQYEIAIGHLKRAVELKPNSVEAHYLLARTYDDKHIPSDGIDDMAKLAISEYLKTIELDSAHLEATRSVAYLYLNGAQWGESERFYRRALQINPKDIPAVYSLGYLLWTRSYQERMEARSAAEIKLKKSFIESPGCTAIREKNLGRVNEAIALLTQWPEVANDRDVKIITNLLYRERADIQCNDPKSAKSDKIVANRLAKEVLDRYCQDRKSAVSHRYSEVPPPPPPPPGHKLGGC